MGDLRSEELLRRRSRSKREGSAATSAIAMQQQQQQHTTPKRQVKEVIVVDANISLSPLALDLEAERRQQELEEAEFIGKEVSALKEVSHEMRVRVQQEDENLNQISEGIEETDQNVEVAKDDLREAVWYNDAANRKKICLLFFAIFLLLGSGGIWYWIYTEYNTVILMIAVGMDVTAILLLIIVF